VALIVSLAAFFALVGLVSFFWSTGFPLAEPNCLRGSRGVPPGFSRSSPSGFFVRSNGCIYSPGYWPWMVLGLTIGAIIGVSFGVGIIRLRRTNRRVPEPLG